MATICTPRQSPTARFHNGSVEIPYDPELEVDFTEYGFSSKNQIQLERKEDMMPRAGHCRPGRLPRHDIRGRYRIPQPGQLATVYQFPSPDA